MPRYYSRFWLTGGQLSQHKREAPDDTRLPTQAELEAWAALPLAARQAHELEVLGQVWSEQPDPLDLRKAAEQRRAANQTAKPQLKRHQEVVKESSPSGA